MTDTATPLFAPRYHVAPAETDTVEFGPTPSQTVGPYLHIALSWPDGPDVVSPGTESAITITVTVLDGHREPIADALVETWQADTNGIFGHPDDPRAQSNPLFRGFGRCAADTTGTTRFTTIKPGPNPTPDGENEAPHLNISIFARGMLNRLITRLYFPDEGAANSFDPVLSSLPESQRPKLIAIATDNGYHLDVVVQDDDPDGAETPFFYL
ncbi:protocatechuate 3,4-dioxygenase subunit alpha [Nocardia sp. NPDC004123]